MIALCVIAAVIILILLIPVGVDAEYIGGNIRLCAKLCGYKICLYPKEKKDKAAKKTKEEASTEKLDKPKKKKSSFQLSFNMSEIFAIAKVALEAVGNFGRKLKVDRFLLHYTAGGTDPCDTANTFGMVNAGLSALAPVCASRYKVKDCYVKTEVDFLSEKMKLDFALTLSIRVGQILAVAFTLIGRALVIFVKNRFRLRKERKQLIKTINSEEGLN